ncbi:MAG TPA: CAP domain-containing protein [Pyrinomonadaceae bacterium]|nr:CAP domain-containing protein [Pyrinomonadaceae bacterium]
MTRNNLFPYPGLRVRRHARFALSVVACLFASGLFAASVEAQTNAVRPVARLVGVSNGGVSIPSRPDSCMPASHMMNASLTSTRPRTARVSATGDERRAFDLINAQRRARGESTLVWDAELTRMARLHSENMARQNFFDHVDPQGQNMTMRARAGGVCGWRAIAENIAYNSGYDDPAGFAVERWMTSSKHRANLLRQGFTHSGVGVARAADGRVFFTQVFVTR